MTSEPVAVWALTEVADRARMHALPQFEAWIGAPFVLVGAPNEPDEKPGEWIYSTAAHKSRGALPQAALEGTIVIPIKKARPDIFPGVVLVGRAASNDVQLDSPSVSKLHARIRLGDDGLFVSDAGSRNGTEINGKPVQGEAPLRAFAVVTFGRRRFTVQDTASLHKLVGKMA